MFQLKNTVISQTELGRRLRRRLGQRLGRISDGIRTEFGRGNTQRMRVRD